MYKIDNVRPPLFPVETTHALSRPRTHQNVTVETMPGLPNGLAGNTIAYDVDQQDVMNAILIGRSSGPIPATAYYKLEQPMPMSAKWAINDNRPESYEMTTNPGREFNIDAFVCREESPYGTIIRPKYSVTSNPTLQGLEDRNDDASAKVRKDVLLGSIRPNFQIVVYDANNHVATEVSASIKEKNNIAAQAALGLPITLNQPTGGQIKLRDYNWTVAQTNVGLDQVILSVENPDIQLERNVPLYATSSALAPQTDITSARNMEYFLPDPLKATAETNLNMEGYNDGYGARQLQDLTKSKRQLVTSSFDNPGFIPTYNVTAPQTRTRDMSRARQASEQYYNRQFE